MPAPTVTVFAAASIWMDLTPRMLICAYLLSATLLKEWREPRPFNRALALTIACTSSRLVGAYTLSVLK